MANNNQINLKLFLPIIAFALMFGVCFLGGNVLIKKISEKVIEQMKRDYTPGPYSPGFDPDKVDPRFFRNSQVNPQQQQLPQQQIPPNSPPSDFPRGMNTYENAQTVPLLDNPEQWNRMWENSRF